MALFGGRHCHCWRSSSGLAGSPEGRRVLASPGSLASVRGAAVVVSGQRARHVQGGRSGARRWQRARHVIGRHALGARACLWAMSPHKQWLCSIEPLRQSMRRHAAAWALHCERDVEHHFLHLRGPCQIVFDLSVSTTWQARAGSARSIPCCLDRQGWLLMGCTYPSSPWLAGGARAASLGQGWACLPGSLRRRRYRGGVLAGGACSGACRPWLRRSCCRGS